MSKWSSSRGGSDVTMESRLTLEVKLAAGAQMVMEVCVRC